MKKWFGKLMLPLIIVVTFFTLLRGVSMGDMIKLMGQTQKHHVVFAFVLMMVYLFCEAWMLDRLINTNKRIRRPVLALETMFIGQFYALITPFASGGQPMQVVHLIQNGLRGAHATAVLVNKFLYFQVGVTLFSFGLFVLNWQAVWPFLNASYGLILLGLAFNMVGLSLLILMVFKSRLVKIMVYRLIQGLDQLRLDPGKLQARRNVVLREIDEFTSSIRRLLVKPWVLVELGLVTLVQLVAYFGITYFVYRALGFNDHTFMHILTLQSILYMSISLIPTPGSAGVAEGGFYLIFSALLPQASVAGGILIWRGITYYLTLLVSGVYTLYLALTTTRKVVPKSQSIQTKVKI